MKFDNFSEEPLKPTTMKAMNSEIKRLMLLLEFADSAFPVGSFSFSNGLETAALKQWVYDANTLEQYTRTVLKQTLRCDAIAALQAFRATAKADYPKICQADHELLLCKINSEQRLMLTRMGKKMAAICNQLQKFPLMQRWWEDIQTGSASGTYPVTQALWFQLNGAREEELFVAMSYGTINMVLNAALRCVKVSHYETQEILYRLSQESEEHYQLVRSLEFEDMQSFAPEFDLFAALHEQGKMRMFMN